MHKYIIMGVQGSGKGTQAKLLKEELDVAHISVGDIYRWHIQSHTKLGARIKRLVAAGELVPDSVVEEVVRRGRTPGSAAGARGRDRPTPQGRDRAAG
jgi:adenylate kinase